MSDNVTRLRPEPQFSQQQLALIAAAAGAMVDAGLQLLDVIGGDFDVEDDGDGEPAGDELDAAWREWSGLTDRSRQRANATFGLEDDEEDGEDCDGFENEPMFDRANCERLNSLFGQGPGGGSLLDSDSEDGI